MDQETYSKRARQLAAQSIEEPPCDERLQRTMDSIVAERQENALPALTSIALQAIAVHTIAREDYPEGPEAYDQHNFGALRALGYIATNSSDPPAGLIQ